MRAVWMAAGVEYERTRVGFCELDLVAARVRRIVGARLTEVTEARHWSGGKRAGDAESLLDMWWRFGHGIPIRLHVHGETLSVSSGFPDQSRKIGEYGEIRVGAARPPDILASVVGARLTEVNVLPADCAGLECGGLRLDFDGSVLVIGASGDAWILTRGESCQRPPGARVGRSCDVWAGGQQNWICR